MYACMYVQKNMKLTSREDREYLIRKTFFFIRYFITKYTSRTSSYFFPVILAAKFKQFHKENAVYVFEHASECINELAALEHPYTFDLTYTKHQQSSYLC